MFSVEAVEDRYLEQALAMPEPPEDIWEIEDPALCREAKLTDVLYRASQVLVAAVGELERISVSLEDEAQKVFSSGYSTGSASGLAEAHDTWSMIRMYSRLPESLRTIGEATHDELMAVMDEKGFFHVPAVNTPNEHDAMGSSIFSGLRERNPNVPVKLLRQQLELEGVIEEREGHNITIERADRARRIVGLSRLDLATGEVTDEIDEEASNDSYYFLDEERRENIQVQEKDITARMLEIYADAISIAKRGTSILRALKAYAHGNITPDEMNGEMRRLIIEPGLGVHLDSFIRDAKHQASDQGLFDPLLTPQEIMMRAGASLDPKYLERPYVPIAIQDGISSVETVRELRSKERILTQTTSLMEYDYPFCIQLADIDEFGETVMSPVFHDEEKDVAVSDKFIEHFRDIIEVPFSRPGDWYHGVNEPKI